MQRDIVRDDVVIQMGPESVVYFGLRVNQDMFRKYK